MSHRRKFVLCLLVGLPLLASCGSTTTIVRAVQHESLPPYSQARANIPEQPPGSLRIYI